MKDTKEVEVRFRDIDALGHVNNAVYLSYFEQARIAFFEKITGGEWDWNTAGVLLAKNELEYFLPVFLNDRVRIVTKTESIGGKSFTLTYEVQTLSKDTEDWKLTTKGRSVLVCYDHASGKTVPVFEEWRDKLLAD